jgi:hypothetical protein
VEKKDVVIECRIELEKLKSRKECASISSYKGYPIGLTNFNSGHKNERIQ